MSNIFDTVVVGAGPAGLTAAIYLARAGKKVQVFERATIGGKITSSPDVRNIPGFISVSGSEFGDNLYQQAVENGVEVTLAEVLSITPIKEGFTVETDDGMGSTASSIIIATGTENRFLGVPGEQELFGKQIHTCVTCDGPFYKDKSVAVIGGGNSAVTEALELSKICSDVCIMQNLNTLTAEKALVDEVLKCNNVTVITDATVESFTSTGDALTIKTVCKGTFVSITTQGAFLAVGMIPQNQNFANIIALDNHGYAKTSTSTPGVFVAGDCTDGKVKQVVTACAEGANAAIKALEYLKHA